MFEKFIRKLLLIDRVYEFHVALPKDEVLFRIREKVKPFIKYDPYLYGDVTKDQFYMVYNRGKSGSISARGQVIQTTRCSIIRVESESLWVLIPLGLIWAGFFMLSLASIPTALACVGSECAPVYFVMTCCLVLTWMYFSALFSSQRWAKGLFLEWFEKNTSPVQREFLTGG